MAEQGGKTANKTGINLEQFIEDTLRRLNYTYIEPSKFTPAMYLKQPIFSHKVRYGINIYGLRSEFDFAIYHPEKHPEGLIIEVKWQQSKGTVDEKFPYLVINIQTKYPYKTILILDGGGYRKGAENWVRSQVGNNLLHVFSMNEFQTWVNKGGL
jgi:hypothetical protein